MAHPGRINTNRIGSNRIGPSMNRKRVITWMTVGVLVTLIGLTLSIFESFPPWPVVVWFAISHAFFCGVVLRTPPFRGPYTPPASERSVEEWNT